ncbi:pyridoxamine 5'-phosphate oxidase family protein [Roseomonas sp. GC11]|uniref:pyridoxamine 5'-phosphate oxidase family protein n=1 Tax=Roseomonas sp. GC11 TaxID=2950546 RepID=UPI00210C06C3|nr:pyridoxamine 5'-phosphate oxidase family protein [Roseomonas sp. GC11]MCQ4158656.1 pyridoxamine 5'-phosphate oxidase family protein [Roseomonas sp. GC11]
MSSRYLEIATTPSVAAARAHGGGVARWTQGGVQEGGAFAGPEPGREDPRQPLGAPERAFIAARDGFYLASVSQTGWPYVQYRGGPPGFLRILEDGMLGFADLRGNRQYITTGNVQADGRVSLFLMDYAHRQRLKIFGRMRLIDAAADEALRERLAVAGYPGRVERLALITVEAFDWNCPQHITPRLTQAELEGVLRPVREELAALRRENERLRQALHAQDPAPRAGPE